MSRRNPNRAPWDVAGPAAALEHLAPLIAERRARQPVVVFENGADALLRDPASALPVGAEAVFVVGPRRRSVGNILPGLFLRGRGGGRVPVGWLPDSGPRLSVHAAAATRVLRRDDQWRSLVVLGQWEDRFLRSCRRMVRSIEKHGPAIPMFQWTAERIARKHLLAGLSYGPGAVVYFGHGRPRGWAAYHGVRAADFSDPWPEPLGALLAICCENASRLRTGISFAEELALRGVFAGAMAAVTKTRYDHNQIWGPALCGALCSPRVQTLAEWIAAADVPDCLVQHSPYRFIGDPAAPLAGANHAAAAAARVFAPAPDDALPIWEASMTIEQE